MSETATTSPTVLSPTSVAELHDAVLDRPGPVRVAGAGTAADWAGDPAPSARSCP